MAKTQVNFSDNLREVAKLMVQNNLSFKQAADELKLQWDATECAVIAKRVEFKRTLREEKYKFHNDVANTPGRNKSSAIGMMQVAIENLLSEGEWDKAVAAIEKLAKLEGWLGSDSNINIFAGLTAKDIAEQKQKILAEIDPQQPIKGSQAPN